MINSKILEIPTWYGYDEFGKKSIPMTIVDNSAIAIGDDVHTIDYWDAYFLYNLDNEALRDKTLVRTNYCIYSAVRTYLICTIYAAHPDYRHLLGFATTASKIPKEKQPKKVSYAKKFFVMIKWVLFKNSH